MNDKRSALAVLTCLMFIMFYTQIFVQPMYDGVREAQRHAQQSEAANSVATVGAEVSGAETVSQPSEGAPKVVRSSVASGPSLQELSQSPVTYVKTDVLELGIVHLGARLQKAALFDYRRSLDSSAAFNLLVDNEGQSILPGGIHRQGESDSQTLYSLQEVIGAEERDGTYYAVDETVRLIFKGQLPGGTAITKTIALPRSSYLLNVRADVKEALVGVPLLLDWSHYLPKSELESRLDPREFQYVTADKKYNSVPVSKLGVAESKQEPNALWIGFGGKYFLEALVNSEGHAISFGRQQGRFFSSMQGEPAFVEAGLYLGPKDRGILFNSGFELWKAVDLGWFAVVAEPLLWLLKLLYQLLGNYGLAIIGLTLIVKLALFPLAKQSYNSMAQMQEIQPEVKRLQELYSKDQQRMQQELMALYKKKGVNPLGGCLPMLFQIPVFLGLYNGLLKSIELRHAPYALWINDLSAPEGLELMGITIPVMILLMGASMIIQQWFTPSAADPQQQKMMMIMPVVFTGMFIVFPMPSGLVLYWLTNNVISIIQQRYLKSHKEASPLLATCLASAGIFAVGFVLTLL